IGQVYKDSSDPSTGQIDYNKVRRLLPGTGVGAPEAIRQGTENESAVAGLDSQFQQAISQGIGELATHPQITQEDISRLKTRLATQRVPGWAVTKALSSAPRDQKGLHDWAVTHS